ncbi:hypothetical protein Tco_1174702 [Tanacetum coccineum]
MACSPPHTVKEIKEYDQKQCDIDDVARQQAIIAVTKLFNKAYHAKQDLKEQYAECKDIPQERSVRNRLCRLGRSNLRRISLTGFPAEVLNLSNTYVLDSSYSACSHYRDVSKQTTWSVEMPEWLEGCALASLRSMTIFNTNNSYSGS